MDLIVADDPVPVAIAPDVHVEASSTSGQVLTADVTNLAYETERFDTHGAFASGVFTAPVDGVYMFVFSAGDSINGYLEAYHNGTKFMRGSYAPVQRGFVSGARRLAAGDTLTVRSGSSFTRSTVAAENYMSIVRIGN
jgi:hypothetical protein